MKLLKLLGVAAAFATALLCCAGFNVGIALLLYGIYGAGGVIVDIIAEHAPIGSNCREDVPHCMAVRNARAKIAPMDEAMLDMVTRSYNDMVPDHVAWAQRCVARKSEFEKIERKSLYPLEFIMAIAAHESAGCKMISATNGDGGQGMMQVTHAAAVYKKRAAAALGLKSSRDINLADPVHNVAVGIMLFDDCERKTGRRDLAFLCYNRGIGGVNRAAAAWGHKKGQPYPRYTLIAPFIRTDVYKTLGPIARGYTGKVLGMLAIVHKVMRGEKVYDIPKGKLLAPNDLPGWDPSHDGDKFVNALLANN